MLANLQPEDIRRHILNRLAHRRTTIVREYLRELALMYVAEERAFKVLEHDSGSEEERRESLSRSGDVQKSCARHVK